jgi:putative heme-binding domain-containing protein
LGQLIGGKPFARDGAGPWLELIGAAGGPKELRQVFDQALRGDFTPQALVRALTALADAARLRNTKPDGDGGAVAALLSAPDEPTRMAATQVAGAWKLARLTPTLLRTATNANASAPERAAAFAALRDIGGAEVLAGLKSVAAESGAPEIRREAVLTLAGLDLPAALPGVMALLKTTTTESDAQALWRALLGIRGAGARLAGAVADAQLPKEVARAGLRPAREGGQNQALVQALMKSAGLSLAAVQLSAGEMNALAQEAVAKGDAARGERLYRRAELACTVCHSIGGAGGKVGPDLSSIGASAPADYLVESLLYPSAKIKEGYHSVLIAKKNGQQFSGTIVKEDASEVVLRDASNAEVRIAMQDVATRTSVGSLMPAGLIEALLPEERLDLVKFLSQLGKPGAYDAPKGGMARAWKLYLVTARNEPYGTERVVRGDFTLRDWQPALSLVNGALPKEAIDLAFPSLSNNRGLFAAAQFESAKGGPVTFEVTGEAKGLWVNGRQAKFGPKMAVEAKAGTNVVVVQLDDKDLQAVKLTSPDVTFVGY